VKNRCGTAAVTPLLLKRKPFNHLCHCPLDGKAIKRAEKPEDLPDSTTWRKPSFLVVSTKNGD